MNIVYKNKVIVNIVETKVIVNTVFLSSIVSYDTVNIIFYSDSMYCTVQYNVQI